MQFKLKLAPSKEPFQYFNHIPVFYRTNNTMIGTCSIVKENEELIGDFNLEESVDGNNYVVYCFHYLSNNKPYLTGVMISPEFDKANTINNSRIE